MAGQAEPEPPVVAGYPRKLTSVHQIEITSRCNLRCPYCPSRDLDKAPRPGKFPKGFGRPKADMDMETFERTLEWCKHFQAEGTQGELSLTGIGEAFLHPQFLEMARKAREALPENYINLSTNGILLDEDMARGLAEINVRVWISLHRPEKAGPAINIAQRYGILDGYNPAASIDAMSWAGQVDWEVSAAPVTCDWLKQGWCAVLQDGRITRCCLDAAAKGVMGTVWDSPGSISTSPFSLCTPCHQVIEEPA